ncbi:PA2779 family protein [Wenzhouxiangella sp. XN24]|uniref:PA2779 family protein n=1 Tax=Wenzhouxiangella sp. XN24 TaxID=2713569 RepID=UPI0013EA070A|nr:PA2779 family protein [Wenzhouxiangella sp. XN24]NGX16125.1 PA2779 family protein [Wenzhouxiangella sp. XN24]
MFRQQFVHMVALCVAVSLGMAGMVSTASAGVIGSRVVVEQAERADTVARVQAVLDREGVQAQLVALGVDPSMALERVAALTDEELRQLDGRLSELPAGAGAVEVVGIVFIVLLILELVGITNIFTSI